MSYYTKAAELMEKVYELAESAPEDSAQSYLAEFAGELLEASMFEHDEKDPDSLLLKRLQEYLDALKEQAKRTYNTQEWTF